VRPDEINRVATGQNGQRKKFFKVGKVRQFYFESGKIEII